MDKRKTAREKLSDVHPDHHFKAKDGSVIKSLHEFEAKLKVMDEDTFSHHVNEEKNDFKNWIEETIHDEKLAVRLSKLKSKDEMIKTLESRISQLERARNVEDMINSAKDKIKKGKATVTNSKDKDIPKAPKPKAHHLKPHPKAPASEHMIHNLKDFTEGVIIGVIIGIIIGKAIIG